MRFPWTRPTTGFKPGDRVICIETSVFKQFGLKPKPGTVRGEHAGVLLVEWDGNKGKHAGNHPILPTEVVRYLPHARKVSAS